MSVQDDWIDENESVPSASFFLIMAARHRELSHGWELDDFIAFRSRFIKRLFKRLDESKATDHDRISAAILKRLADQLAMPFTRICRRMFYEGCWPKTWKLHLIVPIYKKGSAYKAGNYRGVHLTSILSKCAEKVVCFRLVSFLQLNAFGQNQCGFSTGLQCSCCRGSLLCVVTRKSVDISEISLGHLIESSKFTSSPSFTLQVLARGT